MIQNEQVEFNFEADNIMTNEKFKAATHFIVHECDNGPAPLGATRLNKALWNADVLAFKETGQSITGESYLKRQNGPVPQSILATLNELENDGQIVISEPRKRYDTRKYISLKGPNEGDILSEEEKDDLRAAIDFVCARSTTTISDLTHDIVWKSAAIGEVIPLCATLAAKQGEVTKDAKSWAEKYIAERA